MITRSSAGKCSKKILRSGTESFSSSSFGLFVARSPLLKLLLALKQFRHFSFSKNKMEERKYYSPFPDCSSDHDRLRFDRRMYRNFIDY